MEPAGILYFLEGGAKEPAYAAGGGSRKSNTDGPDERRGTLFTPQAGLFDLAYDADNQRWVKIADGTWLGIDKRGRVRPEQLARAEMRPGHKVLLGNSAWEIPVARLAIGGCGLPRRRVLNQDGTKAWEVEEQYRDVCVFADRAWAYHSGHGVIMGEEEIDTAAALALGINYRIGELEAIALGLFTDVGLRNIVWALIDGPTIDATLAAQKKSNEPAGT
jgi:hypothetical protein